VGIKYSGIWAGDLQYQFWGDKKYCLLQSNGKINASFGAQYSGKKYDFPFLLGDLQEFLGFELKRRDLLLKLIMSISFGEGGQVGHFGWGLAYNQSWISYGFDPEHVVTILNQEIQVKDVLAKPENKVNYHALGGFINFKVGYRYAYFVGSLSVYYQKYGNYQLYNDWNFEPKGVTIIPSLGLMFDIGKRAKK